MNTHKIILVIILMLGVTLKLHAQKNGNSFSPTISMLKDNAEYFILCNKSYTDKDSKPTIPSDQRPIADFYFEICEPMNISMEFLDLYYEEQGLSRKECTHINLTITISPNNGLWSKSVYCLSQKISVDSLDNFFQNDSVNLPSGEYKLDLFIEELPLSEEKENNNVLMMSNMPYQQFFPPFELIPYRLYNLSVILRTRSLFLVEHRIPDIPGSSMNSCHSLSAFPEKNMVCVFDSHDGGNSNGNLCLNYFDDLGRPVQAVQQKITPKQMDIVTMQEYDSWGRKSKLWLPTVTSQTSGAYVHDDLCKQQTQKTNEDDGCPYTSFVYEHSPLEKVVQQYSPGSEWHTCGKSVKITELTNVVENDTLDCMSFQCEDGDRENMKIISGKQCLNGSLFVIRIEDEDGKVSFEFKDRSGKLVLMRKVDFGVNGKQLLDTYYVYDNLNRLRAVLPPELSNQSIVGLIPSELLDKYAYLYKYDKLGNQKAKKLPGIGWEYYVYDKNNRLIFSQNGLEREKKEWRFYISDIFGRNCLQGICKNQIDPFGGIYHNMDITCKYTGEDDFAGYALNQGGLLDVLFMNSVIQIANYYDDYNFIYKNDFPSKAAFRFIPQEGFQTKSSNAKGHLTGTLTIHLKECEENTTSEYNWSVSYFDDRSRMVQKVSDDQLGGMERDYFDYDFTGNIIKHLHRYSSSNDNYLSELYTYSYDSAKRLKQIIHKLNNHPEVILVSNEYDELGRLKVKAVNNGTANTSFEYNLRNWLTQISSPFFNQNLYYNNDTGIPCYNGNISSITWNTGSSVTRGYHFTYDGLSRLKDAIYGEGQNLAINSNRFNEQVLEYDKMGNILGLIRYGQTSATDYGLVDNLDLTYDGSQLRKVTDAVADSLYKGGFEFKDGTNQAVEYEYDKNGNLTKDLNKKIADVRYNYLNLPNRIEFENGNVVSYVYDATGKKLRATHIMGNESTVTDYCGNVIYENGVAKTLLTEAGYVSLKDGRYHYFIQDHQGNNRVVIDQDGTVIQENDYYPFGANFAGSTAADVQSYKYNGKELDTKGGLNLYDYGARHYDPVLGRFMTMDPMAEKYYSVSPYAYCLGNPIKFIDPTGMFIETPPGFWDSFGKGFSQPFVNFWNAVSHPVETATGIVNSVKNATPFEIGSGVGEQMLRSPINPTSGALKQLDVVQAMAYDKANGTMTSAEVVGSQWGNIAFDGATTAIGAGVGKVAGTLGKASSGVAKESTSLSKGEVLRIQNAATKINKPIHVVGSRASGKIGPYSDWDYIIEGLTNKDWKSIKNSLPGSKSILDNAPRNIDIIKEPLDVTKPYIKINPK